MFKDFKMKKIITLMFVFLLCFSFASAIDWDDKVKFKKDYTTSKWGKYEIYDSQFLIFQGKKLATYELIDNSYSILTGYAEIDVELFTEEQLFSELNTYNKNSQLTNLKELKIQYGTLEEIRVEQKKYKTTCEDKKNPTPYTCEDIETGTYSITKEEWIYRDYNGEVLPKGKYKIKIEGTREKLNTGWIDWIGTTGAGKKQLKEWAVWWDTDWLNKQPIEINTTESISQGNLSILINITYNADVMSSNFSDLRFLDEEQDDELGIWFYNNTFIDSNSVEVWVIINRNISSSSNTTIYMYSNNPSVSTTSDIEDAFLFGDDFNGGSVDFTNSWVSTNQGLYTTSSGEMVMANTGTSSQVIQTNLTFSNGYVSEARLRTNDVTNNGLYMTFTGSTRGAFTGNEGIDYPLSNQFRATVGGSASTGGTPSVNLRYRLFGSIPASGDANVNVSQDDRQAVLISNSGTPTNRDGFIAFMRFTAGIGNVDWVYVREDYDFTKLDINFGSVLNIGADVILNSPIDGFNSTTGNVIFNCSSSSPSGVINLTRFIDGDINETIFNTTSQQNLTLVTNVTSIAEGSHNWTCEACDNDLCNTAVERDFTIHTTPATINILEPVGQISSFAVGDNQTLRWELSESGQNLTEHIKNCSYIYNGIETQINKTICITTNETSFPYVLGVNNLTFKTIEEFGIVSTNTTFWEYALLEINQTFNNQTTEGSLETFLATIRIDPTLSINNVNFHYNNSASIGQSFVSGDNIILRRVDFLVPNVETQTNNSFIWEVIFSDSTSANLSIQNQTVNNLGLDNCSSFTNELLNFTVVDEELQTILPNVTIEIAVNVYSEDRAVLIINFSSINENVNPLRICLNTNITEDTIYSLDSTTRYEESNHANEYYNIVDSTLTSSSTIQNIILYDLNISDSTEFQLTFTGSDFLPVENALVNVDRQYISENIFKTVELPKTDFNGQAVLHLVRNDVVYNIRIIKDEVVLGNFENLVAFCQDFTIGDCKIELNAFDSVENIFDYDEELGIIFNNPTYNETTNKVSFNFVTTDGTAKEVLLSVTRNDIFGNRSICNSSLISSGGTLTCNVDPNIDESTLNVEVFTDNILTVKGSIPIDTTNYGAGGYLIMFIMAISFALLFSGSKTGVLFSVILTFAGSIGLGLRTGDLIGVGASGLWILIVVFVGIYKLNKERQS